MDKAAVDAVIDGLKRAGVDFVSLMPDSDFAVLQERVVNDPDFTYVPVSNEAIGVEARRIVDAISRAVH